MTIAITGGSGGFARTALTHLLARRPADEIVVITRNPRGLDELAGRGVDIRHGDFDDPSTLPAAFRGVDELLLVSTNRVGTRMVQHTAAISAAADAGVSRIVYTSFAGRGDGNPSIAVADHRATEELIRATGVRSTILRNSQYIDALVEAASREPLRTGVWLSSTGGGLVAPIARAECAEAAAAVVLGDGHDGEVYELTGPGLLTFGDVADIVSKVAGRDLAHRDVTEDEVYARFDAMGIPRDAIADNTVDGVPWSSNDMVTMERSIRLGFLAFVTDHAERLLGRRPQSVAEFAASRREYLRSIQPEPAGR